MSEIGLIGKKIGMTREFYKSGQSVHVTVLKLEKARIIEVIDESKRGYKAVQIGFGNIKTSKISKAMKGFFSKKNTEPKKKLKEFRVKNLDIYKEGNEFGIEIFENVKFVDVVIDKIVPLQSKESLDVNVEKYGSIVFDDKSTTPLNFSSVVRNGDYDYEFKKKHAIKFLSDGAKLKAFVFFRGRSILYKDKGEILLLRLAQELEEYGTVEQLPKLESKKMIMIITPKKNR